MKDEGVAYLILGEGSLPVLQMDAFFLYPHKEKTKSSSVSSFMDTNPVIGALPS